MHPHNNITPRISKEIRGILLRKKQGAAAPYSTIFAFKWMYFHQNQKMVEDIAFCPIKNEGIISKNTSKNFSNFNIKSGKEIVV